MTDYKYIVIGGGVAGGRACESIRQVDGEGSLVIVTGEPHLPYERPPLSKKYLREEAGLDRVILQDEGYYEENRIDVIQGVRVSRVEPKERRVRLEDGRKLGYEKLLLACGGHARRLSIPGSDLKNVFTLRTIEDSQGIRSAGGEGKKALVMGGSFIGAEVAASLSQIGTQVVEIFPESRLLERILPEEASQHLHSLYDRHSVRILPSTIAERLDGDDSVKRAVLDNGEQLEVDLVVMGVGIQLNTQLAREAGLKVREEDKAVIVDEHLRTSDPHIYAAGDIAAWPDPTFNRRLRVEHWDVARRQGRLAGRNMAGENDTYSVLPYFFSDLFDLSFEAWGSFSKWERTVTRGSLSSGSFAIYYFDDGKLTGVLAVNRPDEERVPMQTLVESRAAYQNIADDLQDEETDLEELSGEKPEGGEELEEALSFSQDIRPLFREKDITEMNDISGFDLSDYEDVRQWASSIYARLADGSMPCDEPWSEEHVAKFKRWMDTGSQP